MLSSFRIGGKMHFGTSFHLDIMVVQSPLRAFMNVPRTSNPLPLPGRFYPHHDGIKSSENFCTPTIQRLDRKVPVA